MYRQNDNDKTDCKKKFDHPTYSLGHTLSKYIHSPATLLGTPVQLLVNT